MQARDFSMLTMFALRQLKKKWVCLSLMVNRLFSSAIVTMSHDSVMVLSLRVVCCDGGPANPARLDQFSVRGPAGV